MSRNRHQFTEPRVAEWEPTYSLDRQVSDARQRMGEARWNRLMKEWERNNGNQNS